MTTNTMEYRKDLWNSVLTNTTYKTSTEDVSNRLDDTIMVNDGIQRGNTAGNKPRYSLETPSESVKYSRK